MALLKQPQVNSTEIMQLLGAAANGTQPNTPERTQLVKVIRTMMASPAVVAKVPQLGQINLEAVSPKGNVLTEASAGELKRSELDRIFITVCRDILHHQSTLPTEFDTANDNAPPRQASSDGTQSNTKGEAKLRPYLQARITAVSLDYILRHTPMRSADVKIAKLVHVTLNKMPGGTTLGTLLKEFHKNPEAPKRLPDAVIDLLIKVVTDRKPNG